MTKATFIMLRKWLIFLPIFSVLFSIQTSYACMMMSEMDLSQSDCCCGALHRMSEQRDVPFEDGSNGDGNSVQLLNTCCKVEMSLDLDDAADKDPIASNHISIKLQLSVVKIVDDPILPWDLALLSDIAIRNKFYSIAIPFDPKLRASDIPVYLKTERFRI